MTLKQRLQAPTPAFFKKIRNLGLTLAALGALVSFSVSIALKSLLRWWQKP